MEYKILIILHVLGAAVWVGGHLMLAISILPKALKTKQASLVLDFEKHYEKLGIPALIIQVLTGFRLAMIYQPMSEWFSFSNPTSSLIGYKLIGLLSIIMLAIHARFFIIPKLSSSNLGLMGLHIVAVTVISVLMLVWGVSFRM